MSDALIRAQRTIMSDWSEESYCAGWMSGLEEMLWHGTAKEMGPFDQTIADIHEIARTTGVWVTYDETVPLPEWEAKHGPPLTRMADNPPTPEQQATLERIAAEHEAWMKSPDRFWNR